MVSQNQRNPKKIVAVAAFAAFLATFNETYLNVAFAPIMADLGVSVSTVQWLATAYMLGAAVMVPVSAFAYRRIPTRPLFLCTVGLLICGSVIGALATTFPVLLAGRIVQSLGTGMLIPIGMNITLEVAPREKLGSYMGIMGAMTTLGPSLSVIMAGGLLALSGWHLLLWVFGGLCAVLFLCGAVLLPNLAKLTNPRLDAFSVALIGIALIGILYGISTVFSGQILIAAATAAVGVVCLCFFISRQKKLKEPLINLQPLSSKPFATGVILNMLSLVIIFAMNIVTPIFVQSALGASSLAASLTLFPAILLSCVVAPLAGKVYDRHGVEKLLPVGFLLICLFAAAVALFRGSGSLVLLAVLYIPIICGSALIIGPVQSFALSRLRPELNPHGVTVMSTGFQIAGCVGASVFASIYSMVMANRAATGADIFTASGDGFLAAGLLAALAALIGFGISLSLKRFGKEETPAAAPVSLLETLMKKDVYTIDSGSTLLDAMRIISEKKISGAPVVDQAGNLAGFVSDGDILRFLAKKNPLFVNAYSLAVVNSGESDFSSKLSTLMDLKIMDVAVKKLITVNSGDSLEEVCRVLHDNHLKKVPVMRNGKMVGIINSSNITKYAVRQYLDATQQ